MISCCSISTGWRIQTLLLLALQLLALQQCSCTRLTAAAAAAAGGTFRSSDDVVFSSGTVPTDIDGNPDAAQRTTLILDDFSPNPLSYQVLGTCWDDRVFAHEGWLLTNEDAYLWYGSSQKRNVSDGTTWGWVSDSILLYTSHDLNSWRKRATLFTADQVPNAVRHRLLGGRDGPLRLERPKVLYNAARRYYVLMFALGSLDRSRAEVGWAVGVGPYGPFKFDGARQPDGLPSWDITVAANEDDSQAWLARSVPGTGIVISQLNPDYLDSAGHCATITPAEHLHTPTGRLRPLAHVITWLQQHSSSSSSSSSWVRPGLTAAQTAAATAGGSLRSGAHTLLAALRHLSPTTAAHHTTHGQAQDKAGLAVLHFDQSATGPSAAVGDVGAPCLFRFKGKWYLLATQSSGWTPAKSILYVNDGSSPCDEASWRQLPAPARGAGASHTFDSTPAFVYAHSFEGTDQVLLVYFGDRWHPADPQGPSSASYVWLPLVAADSGPPDSLQLLNLNSWRLGDFRAP